MILQITTLIDENWLSAILGIAFSLFIFLLGVPTIFFQTFLPEEIRHIYNKRLGVKERYIFVLLCISIILFSITVNHGIKYYITEKLTVRGVKDNYYLGYYFLVFSLFISFVIAANWIFLRFIYIKENIRNGLVKQIIKDTKKNYLKFGQLKHEDIADLTTIGKTASPGENKSYTLKGVSDLVKFILNLEEEVKYSSVKKLFRKLNSSHKSQLAVYDGCKLELILDLVIYETIFNRHDTINSKNLKEVVDICRLIHQNQGGVKNIIDKRALGTLLTEVALIALENEIYDIVKDAMELIYKLPNDQNNFYRISFKALNKGKLVFVSTSVKRMITNLITKRDDTHRTIAILNNLFAYLAWLFQFNGQTKQFVSKSIEDLIYKQMLTKGDIQNARKHFYNIGEYVTAQNIQDLLGTEKNLKSLRFYS